MATHASGSEVQVSVSQRETDVGIPVVLTVEITNASSHERPTIPDVPGLLIQPIPGEQTSSMTTIINGRMTQRNSVAIRYRIVPQQPGTFTIPSFKIVADGVETASDPIDILVSKAEGGGDLLFVQVQADRPSVYLGQPLKAVLRIWIKPYQDKQFQLRLDRGDMWNMIDVGSSTWGEFAEALNKMRDPFGSLRIQSQEVLRDDGQGNQRSYYLYEIPLTIWPQQTGRLAMEPPRIVVSYPLRLARQDSFFPTGRLAVAESRTISQVAEIEPIEVKAPPSAGQPVMFNGAVGKFDIAVSAKPTDVAVGDPITLTITVFDRSGESRLDLLPPPPLDRIAELTDNFKMPSDPLAGAVNGNAKTFTQTLRAKSADVTRIPPITLAFFDPTTETYATQSSEPISLHVRGGSQLGMNDIVQAPNAGPSSSPTELKEVAGGILANYADIDALLATKRLEVGWVSLALLAGPPLLFVSAALSRISTQRRHRNAGSIRRRTARKRALAQLKVARSLEPRAQAQSVIASLSEFVSDRMNMGSGNLTATEIVEAVRQRCAADGLQNEVQQLLDECEQAVYAGNGGAARVDDLTSRAVSIVNRLERNLR